MITSQETLSGYKVKCDGCQALVINGVGCHEQGCHGYPLQFIGSNGRKYIQFEVWLLDAWGNETEGFEVNNRSRLGHITVLEDCDNQVILREMKDLGFLNKAAKYKSFDFEWNDAEHAYIDWAKTGEPLFELSAR